jgi:hypothetical protein
MAKRMTSPWCSAMVGRSPTCISATTLTSTQPANRSAARCGAVYQPRPNNLWANAVGALPGVTPCGLARTGLDCCVTYVAEGRDTEA